MCECSYIHAAMNAAAHIPLARDSVSNIRCVNGVDSAKYLSLVTIVIIHTDIVSAICENGCINTDMSLKSN